MTITMILNVMIIFSICHFSIGNVAKMITEVNSKLHMPIPANIYFEGSIKARVEIIKQLTAIDMSINFVVLHQHHKSLIVIANTDLMSEWIINIDQEIYFITTSLELYERYDINHQIVIRRLGHFNKDTFELIINTHVETEFHPRRRNFSAKEMIIMHDHYTPNLYLEDGFEKFAPFHPLNQTYEMKDVKISGIFADVLDILKEEFNFTTRAYTRKDHLWGSPTIWPNGSMTVSEGMIQDLMDNGKADMVVAGMGDFYPRNLVIDFTQPIGDSQTGIFIKKSNLEEVLDFSTFFKPLNIYMWIVLGTLALIFSFFTLKMSKPGLINGLVNILVFLKALLGSGNDLPQRTMTNKIIIITSLTGGFIVWTSYTAFLTSELALPKQRFPFNDLESLIETDFKLLTDNFGTGPTEYLINQAKPGSVIEKVLKNNMDQESFKNYYISLEEVLSRSNVAFFGEAEPILYDAHLKNSLEMVWTLKPKLYGNTFALRAGSPYRKFLDWKIMQLKESGVIHVIKKKYEPPVHTERVKPNDQSITWKKIAFLWIVILSGFLVSVLSLLVELFMARFY